MIIPNRDYTKGILNEPYKEFQKKQVVKLPCGHYSVEITQYGDQYLECPKCHRKFLLTNNKYGSKKIYGEN